MTLFERDVYEIDMQSAISFSIQVFVCDAGVGDFKFSIIGEYSIGI